MVDSRRAWIAVLGISLANGIAFGTAYTFGTFFDAMSEEFDAARGSTALIFAFTLLLFFGFGVVSGPISDRVGPRPPLIVGGLIFIGGLLLTSAVNQLWVGYLTYAMVGLGGGCFVAPLTAAAGLLFERQRAAALGVVAVGNGLGTMLLIPLAERLIDTQGWRTAFRGLAAVAAVGFIIALVVLVRPEKPGGPDASAVGVTSGFARNPNFVRLFGASALMSAALFSAFALFVPFTKENDIASATSARLFALIGLSSILGRLGLTGLSARLGALRLMQLTMFAQPVVYAIWWLGSDSVPVLAVFTLVLGVVYGGFVAISPEVVIVLFGRAHVGRLMGLFFLSFGVGGLIGPPLAGVLDDETSQRTVIFAIILVAGLASAAISTVQNHVAETSTLER